MDPVIYRRAHLAGDPQTAFDYSGRDDLLMKILTNHADVEAKVGGRFGLARDPENKPRGSALGCSISTLAADQLLAFEGRALATFDAVMNHLRPPLTHVVISSHALTDQPAPACVAKPVHIGLRPDRGGPPGPILNGPGGRSSRHSAPWSAHPQSALGLDSGRSRREKPCSMPC
jgi:hypothetical protein